MPKAGENKKNLNKNPSKDPLGHQIHCYTKKRGAGLPCVSFKIDLLVGAAKTEENQILGSPLMVST